MKYLNKLFLTIFLSTLSAFTYASHVSGGNIAYSCTGVPNEFLVTLTLYRDCSGIGAPAVSGYCSH